MSIFPNLTPLLALQNVLKGLPVNCVVTKVFKKWTCRAPPDGGLGPRLRELLVEVDYKIDNLSWRKFGTDIRKVTEELTGYLKPQIRIDHNVNNKTCKLLLT